jgi:hypothetical protein
VAEYLYIHVKQVILLGVNIKIDIVTLDQLVISIILLLIKHEANLMTLSILEGQCIYL